MANGGWVKQLIPADAPNGRESGRTSQRGPLILMQWLQPVRQLMGADAAD